MAEFLLAPGILEGIIAHAQFGYPEEVCGLIAGPPPAAQMDRAGKTCRIGRGIELYTGRNVSPDPRHHFVLDVDTLARQIEFAERGLIVSAIYHSHPQGPETPSVEDVDQALYPSAVCIICSLALPGNPVVRGFLISDEGASEVRLLQTFDNGGTIR